MSYEELVADPSMPGSGFDAIVANFSHLDDRAEELARALRPALTDQGRPLVQTIHPRVAGGDVDGWRTEMFDSIPGDWAEPMPWYFRTMSSWSRVFSNAGCEIVETREPVYPDRDDPASILFICRAGSLTKMRPSP